MYDFAFADGREFDLIAHRRRPARGAGHRRRSIPLSPGERAEIVVTMAPGERVALQSQAPDPALNAGSAELRRDGAAGRGIPRRLTGGARDAREPADRGCRAAPPPSATFVMSGHDINDREMDMSRVDFVATVDTSEVWTVRNDNPLPHSFHVHDTQFRVLSVDGDPPPARLAGWKDTIALERDREYRLLVRFEDYADPTTPYMYHCHLLWHEDQGMMGQFLVVEPGQQPDLKRPEGETDDHHDH